MKHELSDFFAGEDLSLWGVAPAAPDLVTSPERLRRAGLSLPGNPPAPGETFPVRSLLVIAVPYFAGYPENFSAYAAAPDYHSYFDGLFSRLGEVLRALWPRAHFAFFADKSPFSETRAAELAGLGSRGDNMLFLTEDYSSFVFLGEAASDLLPEEWELPARTAPELCLHCGACRRACPGYFDGDGFVCLSALTQKKGTLTEEEKDCLRRLGSVWGCDVCQRVCPVTKKAAAAGTLETPLAYFRRDRIARLDYPTLAALDDEAFARRAFAWRKRETVLRNLEILYGPDEREKEETPC